MGAGLRTSRMLRSVVLAGAVASTAAFAPMPALAPRLRIAQPANVQMAMNSDSFSVLTDNQKVYKSTGTAENPYMSQQEKMDNLERQARIEDCERVKNRATCIDEEDYREG